MTKMDRRSDQRVKLSQARSALLAPHPRGEEQSFAEAFRYCAEAFDRFDLDKLDEAEKNLAQTVHRLMDVTGLEDKSGRGAHYERARLMSTDERLSSRGHLMISLPACDRTQGRGSYLQVQTRYLQLWVVFEGCPKGNHSFMKVLCK